MESLAELNTVFNFYGCSIDNNGETFDQLVKRKYRISKLIMFIMPGTALALLTALQPDHVNEDYADVGWKPRAELRPWQL